MGGGVRRIVLDESVLFGCEDPNGKDSLLPAAEYLLRKLRHSTIPTEISYRHDLSAQKASLLQGVAVQYSFDCFVLDESSTIDALNEIQLAWGDIGGSILYLVSDNNDDLLLKLRTHGWLLVILNCFKGHPEASLGSHFTGYVSKRVDGRGWVLLRFLQGGYFGRLRFFIKLSPSLGNAKMRWSKLDLRIGIRVKDHGFKSRSIMLGEELLGYMPLLSPRMGHPNDANVKCHKRLDLFSPGTNIARESRMQWCRYMGEDDVLLQETFELDTPQHHHKKLKSIFMNLVKEFSSAKRTRIIRNHNGIIIFSFLILAEIGFKIEAEIQMEQRVLAHGDMVFDEGD
ncbi:hypothetical protein CK203_052179 [Vitis vinifera]|uniref:Uncharacterized protein n=1 Tax=Vitis vinifera TaxID=29760 RepID=A0A438GA39_VITVI|nr:hypothetical protein CK203_052179 [Vitis vinifera]